MIDRAAIAQLDRAPALYAGDLQVRILSQHLPVPRALRKLAATSMSLK
jgi:hypothetical protein